MIKFDSTKTEMAEIIEDFAYRILMSDDRGCFRYTVTEDEIISFLRGEGLKVEKI